MVLQQHLALTKSPWGTLSPRPPGIYRFGAKIEREAGDPRATRPSTSARSRRSGCFPAEPYPPVRLKGFIPLAWAPCNPSADQPRIEQQTAKVITREEVNGRPGRDSNRTPEGVIDPRLGPSDAEYDPPSTPTSAVSERTK